MLDNIIRIPQKYSEYLAQLREEFARNSRPISKEIMVERLVSKFNQSPEYCTKVVKILFP